MATSILIARLIGPILLVAAVAMLADVKGLQEMARDFLANRALIYISGFLAMLGGVTIVNTHNVWIADWPVIITLFGWALIIAGVIRMTLPSMVRSMGGAMIEKPALIRLAAALWLLVGAVLTYKGYFQVP